jgi:hypothetical protein
MESVGRALAVVQRRATEPVDACFEELSTLDRELSRLSRSAGALRFAIALGLAALAKGGHRELGFPSMAAYGRERCERRSRWTEQSLSLARRAADLPLLRGALLSGRISWSKAVVLARVAGPGDEAEWLAAASTLSVKRLGERARAKAGGGAEIGDGGDDDAGDQADEEARCTLTVTVNAEEAWMFECASFMVRHLEGAGAPVASIVEAAMGEGMTSLLPLVPRDAREPPDDDAAGAAQRAYNAQREQWRAEAEDRCEATILRAPEVLDCGVESTVRMDGSPEDIDAEVRCRASELAELSARIGALAEVFIRAGGWRRLGYATLRQYSGERLGMSVSSLNEKRRLARGSRRLPKAARSMRERKIGFEAARLVTEVASPATEESWVRRAEERTVVHLQEEVRAAGVLTRLGLNGDSEPPSVEMMTALRELEVRVVTGADLPVKMRGRIGRCQRDAAEQETAGHKCADAPVACDAVGPCVEASLVQVSTASQISAALPCSMEDSDHRVYAGPAFRELERALAREGKVPRSLRSKGRMTLRLRVTEGTRRTYRWLERLHARYRPSNESFLAYCCSELLGVWAHARPPVAYESVYARDGYRCANPVCGARHVTPHHVVFRSRGGSDGDENVTSLCVNCHLEKGVHAGCITVTGSAPDLVWVIGKNGHTLVQGRRRVRVTP